jgi:hypothetical protein
LESEWRILPWKLMWANSQMELCARLDPPFFGSDYVSKWVLGGHPWGALSVPSSPGFPLNWSFFAVAPSDRFPFDLPVEPDSS